MVHVINCCLILKIGDRFRWAWLDLKLIRWVAVYEHCVDFDHSDVVDGHCWIGDVLGWVGVYEIALILIILMLSICITRRPADISFGLFGDTFRVCRCCTDIVGRGTSSAPLVLTPRTCSRGISSLCCLRRSFLRGLHLENLMRYVKDMQCIDDIVYWPDPMSKFCVAGMSDGWNEFVFCFTWELH